MKTDKKLGLEIKQYLIKQGKEVPLLDNNINNKKEIIKHHFTNIMECLGLDLNDDSLKDTPQRVADMYIDEMFYGLDYNNFPKCTSVENKMQYDEMVIEKNITAISNCEHHFVIIDGLCHIGYIPKEKVLGLSKLNRIVDFFCKRPQIQERLVEQIYYALNYILQTEDIIVIINAVHYCVKARGIKDINSNTTTSKLGGKFKNPEVRKEFLLLIK